MDSESAQRQLVLLAIRLMVATFVVVTLGTLAVTQVQARAATSTADGLDKAPSGPQQSAPVSVLRLSGKEAQRSMVGSGFPVGRCILTNQHIVANESQVVISDGSVPSPGSETWGEVILASPDSDVAVLADAEGQFRTAGIFASEAVSVGQPVAMVGYRGGSAVVRISGLVHAVVDGSAYGISGSVVLIDTLSSQGMSGGPVVDQNGEVVGMLSRVDELTGLTVAIPAATLESYIDQSEELC